MAGSRPIWYRHATSAENDNGCPQRLKPVLGMLPSFVSEFACLWLSRTFQ
jgi:hypothetical protein